MEPPPEETKTPFEKFKYYTTLTLGTVACLSVFVFFFMVPFVLDPSISTLVADFDPDPIVCMTVHTDSLIGMKNCSWSSCRHGCTIDQYYCDQIYVNYLKIPYSSYDGTIYEEDDPIWTKTGLPVFINIKACGYPPRTNCSVFGDEHAAEGTYFPCYYSRRNPDLIITEYSWEGAVHPMILAFIVPNLLTAVSLGIVSYWWYPGCQKKQCQYELPPDQGDSSSQHGEGEEEDEVKEGLHEDDQEEILKSEAGKKKGSIEIEKEVAINLPDA